MHNSPTLSDENDICVAQSRFSADASTFIQTGSDRSGGAITTYIYSNPESLEISDFYKLLIQRQSAWDLLPFIETLGANLCQNFYFLLMHSQALCFSSELCKKNIGITLCCADFLASGIQNTYQRYWKSVTWAWIARLSSPTAEFINILKECLEKNKGLSALIVYISQRDFAKINRQDNEDKTSCLTKIYTKGVKRCTLQDSVELLAAYFQVDIILIATERNTLTQPLSTTEVIEISPRSAFSDPLKTLHFNYSLDFTIENNDELVKTCPLTLEHLRHKLWDMVCDHDATHFRLMYKKNLYKRFFTTTLSPSNLFSGIFLEFIPYQMLAFQTIGMLTKIVPNSDNDIAAANFIFICGYLFGWGKGTVNNALRRTMAEENLRRLEHREFYVQSTCFLLTTLLNIFYGFVFLLPCNWNPRQFIFHFFPALLRLVGIVAGISISLFYLYVGLFTKDGIEFTLKTTMRDLQVNSHSLSAEYDKARFSIDFACVISSLSYNGLLTQLIESCNKMDDFAKALENWINPLSSDLLLPLPTSSSKEKAPGWVHLANIGDILVFSMSAHAAIGQFLEADLEHSYFSFLSMLQGFLNFINYALVGGITAGLANLIFTYTAAASGQMKAWELLSDSFKSAVKNSCSRAWCRLYGDHQYRELPDADAENTLLDTLMPSPSSSLNSQIV